MFPIEHDKSHIVRLVIGQIHLETVTFNEDDISSSFWDHFTIILVALFTAELRVLVVF
jgi:uncharacterized protein (DUF983 family)